MIEPSTNSGFQQALLKQKKTLRFETLLWGGDEMLFVLPAWLGFEFLQYFFQISQNWKVEDKALTHAAGLIFCSANTPINNIRELTQSLAETVKNTSQEDSPNDSSGREQNAWNYMVLESIDYPTHNDIADFNARHYGKFFHKPPLISAASDWQQIKATLDLLINQRLLSRRQLYRVVQTLNNSQTISEKSILSWEKIWKPEISNERSDELDENVSTQEKQERRLFEVSKSKERLADNLSYIAKHLFDLDINKPEERLCLWVYLYDLWDYLIPQITAEGAQQ